MDDDNVPCTILDNPVRVRLFIDDVTWLRKNNIDVNNFIRGTVRVRIEEIKKKGIISSGNAPRLTLFPVDLMT